MSLQLLEPPLRAPPPAPKLPSPPIGEGSPLRSPCPSILPRSLLSGAAHPVPASPRAPRPCGCRRSLLARAVCPFRRRALSWWWVRPRASIGTARGKAREAESCGFPAGERVSGSAPVAAAPQPRALSACGRSVGGGAAPRSFPGVSLHELLVRAWEVALRSRTGWRALVWLSTNLLGFDQRGKVP